MTNEQSDAEVLSHVVSCEPPPSGFDPLTASDHLLHKHGFPHRPDPNKEPRLSKLWHDSLSQPFKMIKAELAVDHMRPPRDRLRQRTDTFGVNRGWAGGEVNRSALGFPATELVNTVYAQWLVPTVFAPANNQQTLVVGFWVGIGGDANNGSNEVVQAGVEGVVQGQSVSYYAWTQWWPYQPNAITVQNFSVSPGQRVEFVVTTPQLNRGFVSMRNFNTGFATNVHITPTGAASDGSSAEWIIEGDPPLLAQFSPVLFVQCQGGTKSHDSDLTDAHTLTITSSNGFTTLANAKIPSKSAVEVFWDGLGP